MSKFSSVNIGGDFSAARPQQTAEQAQPVVTKDTAAPAPDFAAVQAQGQAGVETNLKLDNPGIQSRISQQLMESSENLKEQEHNAELTARLQAQEAQPLSLEERVRAPRSPERQPLATTEGQQRSLGQTPEVGTGQLFGDVAEAEVDPLADFDPLADPEDAIADLNAAESDIQFGGAITRPNNAYNAVKNGQWKFSNYTRGENTNGIELQNAIDKLQLYQAPDAKGNQHVDPYIGVALQAALDASVYNQAMKDPVVRELRQEYAKKDNVSFGEKFAQEVATKQEPDARVKKEMLERDTGELAEQFLSAYQKSQGLAPAPLSAEEKAVLGRMATSMGADLNPDMYKDTGDAFLLVGDAHERMNGGREFYRNLLQEPVQDTSAVAANQLPEDLTQQDVARKAKGVTGTGARHYKDTEGRQRQAAKNMGSVPYTTNNNNLSWMLAAQSLVSNPAVFNGSREVQAGLEERFTQDPVVTLGRNILGVGTDKTSKYTAKQKLQATADSPAAYDPLAVLEGELQKANLGIKSLAGKSGQAFFVYQNIAAYNGRYFPVPTILDPVGSKVVRAGMASATPRPVKKGSRQESNFLFLVGNTLDLKFPGQLAGEVEAQAIAPRDVVKNFKEALKEGEASPILQKARRVKAIKRAMLGDLTDGELAKQVAETDAIPEWLAQNFSAAFDPEVDAELLAELSKDPVKKLEAYEALADWYDNVGSPNAPENGQYMANISGGFDATSSGLFINAMSYGIDEIVKHLGIHMDTVGDDRSLLFEGDLRDKFSDNLKEQLNMDNMIDVNKLVGDKAAIKTVAREVFAQKSFRKSVTMTVPYGRSLRNIHQEITQTLAEVYENRQSLMKGDRLSAFEASYDSLLAQNPDLLQGAFGKAVLPVAQQALTQTLSPRMFKGQKLKSRVATYASLLGQVMTVNLPNGVRVPVGGIATAKHKNKDNLVFTAGGREQEIQQEVKEFVPGAVNKDGGIKSVTGIVPQGTQGIDAAIMTDLFSDKNFARLSELGGGTPYSLGIHDDFGVDSSNALEVYEMVNEIAFNEAIKYDPMADHLNELVKLKKQHKELYESMPEVLDVSEGSSLQMASRLLEVGTNNFGNMLPSGLSSYMFTSLGTLKSVTPRDTKGVARAYNQMMRGMYAYVMFGDKPGTSHSGETFDAKLQSAGIATGKPDKLSKQAWARLTNVVNDPSAFMKNAGFEVETGSDSPSLGVSLQGFSKEAQAGKAKMAGAKTKANIR